MKVQQGRNKKFQNEQREECNKNSALDVSISLTFLMQTTRLESEFFEPLIDFLAFLVQKV